MTASCTSAFRSPTPNQLPFDSLNALLTSRNAWVPVAARDLGVIVDSQLTMSAHVGAVCRSAYGYLRQLRSVTRVLLAEAAKTVGHALISSRLDDYCNSLLFGISDNLLRRLQAVQNAAARLVHCCCCWTASVEQSTSSSTWFWTHSPGVPPVSENVPVSLRTATPSDCLLFECLCLINLHLAYIYITLHLHVAEVSSSN